MNKTIILLAAITGLLVSCKHELKVACLGDSITEGAGTESQSLSAYPVALNKALGSSYAVLNCGRSGATLQQHSDLPIWKCNEFSNVFVFKPDIIVICLGTNDSKNFNWNAANYEKDYQSMIDTLKTIASHPKIYLCLPPPVFKMAWSIDDSTVVHGILPIIKKLAESNELQTIDLNHGLRGLSEDFPDGVHPNEKGASDMAGIIAKAIRH
jgi:acyl-CoA thioesterase I